MANADKDHPQKGRLRRMYGIIQADGLTIALLAALGTLQINLEPS